MDPSKQVSSMSLDESKFSDEESYPLDISEDENENYTLPSGSENPEAFLDSLYFHGSSNVKGVLEEFALQFYEKYEVFPPIIRDTLQKALESAVKEDMRFVVVITNGRSVLHSPFFNIVMPAVAVKNHDIKRNCLMWLYDTTSKEHMEILERELKATWLDAVLKQVSESTENTFLLSMMYKVSRQTDLALPPILLAVEQGCCEPQKYIDWLLDESDTFKEIMKVQEDMERERKHEQEERNRIERERVEAGRRKEEELDRVEHALGEMREALSPEDYAWRCALDDGPRLWFKFCGTDIHFVQAFGETIATIQHLMDFCQHMNYAASNYKFQCVATEDWLGDRHGPTHKAKTLAVNDDTYILINVIRRLLNSQILSCTVGLLRHKYLKEALFEGAR